MWARHQERDTEAKMFLCGTGGRWPTDTWLLCLDFVWLYWCYWSPPHCKVLVSWLDMFWPDDLAHEGVRHHVFKQRTFFSAAELLTLKALKSYQLEACVARIVFPVLGWGVNYQFGMFFSDVMSSIEPWLASSSLHGWGDQNCWSTFFTAESRISRVICQVLQELNLEQASQLLWSIPTPVLQKKIKHVNVYNSLITVYCQLSPRFQYQRQPLKEWFAEALLLKDTVVLWFNLTGYNQFSPSEDHVGRRIGGLGLFCRTRV